MNPQPPQQPEPFTRISAPSDIRITAGGASHVAGPGVPASVPGMMPSLQQQQQLFFQQQMHIQNLFRTGQITPQMIQQQPQLQVYLNLLRQQAALQQQLKGAGTARPPTVVPTSAVAGRASAAAAANAPIAAAFPKRPASSTGTGGSVAKKRRVADRVPDKYYTLLPESPLFAELQNIERRIDAALTKKRGELQEMYNSLARGPPAVGADSDLGTHAGSARKRIRIYIFSQHFNQHDESSVDVTQGPPHADAEAPRPREPPSWALTIHGRVVDPSEDGSHPGGGGDATPNLLAPKHHFSQLLRRLKVTMSPEQQSAGEVEVTEVFNKEWMKIKHDRDNRDGFQIRQLGSCPMHARIEIELDHSPSLYRVSSELESALSLPAGSGTAGGTASGGGGLYSMPYLVGAVWRYAKRNDLCVNGGQVQGMRFDQSLCKAFNLEYATVEESGAPLVFNAVEAAVKNAVKPAEPIVVEYAIATRGDSPSKPMCLDLHIEIPLTLSTKQEKPGLEDSRGPKPPAVIPEYVKGLKLKLDSELQTLDHGLMAMIHRYREHKRRHTMLAALSIDPEGTLNALVAAQARELRLAAAKDAEAVEVLRSGEVYKDRWAPDAIFKYLSKKAAVAGATATMAFPSGAQYQQQLKLLGLHAAQQRAAMQQQQPQPQQISVQTQAAAASAGGVQQAQQAQQTPVAGPMLHAPPLPTVPPGAGRLGS